MLTQRRREVLLGLCDPIVRIGWCGFDRKDRGQNIIAGHLAKQGLVDRRKFNSRWEYRINRAGLAELQWEIDTAIDIKRIAAIVDEARGQVEPGGETE